MKLRGLFLLSFVLIVQLVGCTGKTPTTTTATIPAGSDLFQTDPETTFFNFEKMPIPAGLFATDSYPFTGTVRFRGAPLPRYHFNGLDITHVDTIVKREQPLTLSSSYPASGKVPVEMTGLSLLSVEPIKVQVGKREELWDVQVELSSLKPSKGTMVITKTDSEGGTFESELTVYPVFRFTRLDDGEEKVLDTGKLEMTAEMRDKFTLRASQVPWRHTAPPKSLTIKGMNDNFFAGGTARFKESGEVCAHGAGVPTNDPPDLSCDVTATRGATIARFTARGTTSPGATVTIHRIEGNCNPAAASPPDPLFPSVTANAAGRYTIGPHSTFPSHTPGIGRPVLVNVTKGSERAFCCATVQAQN